MEELITAITPSATKRAFKKGTVLLYQGEAPRMAYILKSGIVKSYTINTNGEEQIVNFFSINDIFPAPWIFNKASTTMYYYETASNCEILTIPRDMLREAMAKPEWVLGVQDYLATNYTSMLMRVTALEQSRARDKIMLTLYFLLFRYGKQTKPGVFTIELALTHNIIASLVGLTRETTTTELSKLKKQKIVQYSHHTYVVDKQRLERLLGEDSFGSVSL
ncbi:MAG TPA: Crp/Fnr family transcriptional regulator [Candidatus Saccharimonadales bacterium]|nr:Crp/Fnr family transcriptional regulator [Candidatus Saccharimonadales bacterium]